MFDIDWLGDNEPPNKKRRKRRTKAEMEAARAEAAKYTTPKRHPPKKIKRKLKLPPDMEARRKSTGRKKGEVHHSVATRAKMSKSSQEQAWRRQTPNKGGASLQSSSGYADCTVYSEGGRVLPRIREDWDG